MARELAILVTARNMSGGVFREVRGDIKGIQSEARRAASNIGRNVGIGVAAASVGIGMQVKAGLDSLVELEEANAQTAAAIKSTGGAAGLTADDIRSMSEQLERQTTIDDKLIQSGANVLLTFRRVNKDAFGPALELAMDLSTRLGTDLNSAVLQVGKALEDPVRGVTALRRAGVQLSDEQVEQIKTLVEQNDLYGAQRVLLEELETQVGGSARALSEGAGGAQRRWADAVEDMQMSLAQGFLPLIEKVSDKVQKLVSDPQFMSRVEAFGQTIASGFERGLAVIEQIPWDQVASAMEITAGAADAILGTFTSLPPWVQTAVITGWGLNKLSGGALGNIVGTLGSGLIKGVLGMNAGVVNINAGVVNGGAPGAPGAGGGGGLGMLGALGLAGAGLGTVTAVGTAIHQDLNPTGHSFNALAGQKGVSRVQVEGDLLDLSAETGRSVTSLQSEMIPLLEIGNLTWSQIVDQVESGRDATVAATERAENAIRDAIPWAQRNVRETEGVKTRMSIVAARAAEQKAAIHALNASEGARAANQHALLASIRDKKSSVTAVINTTVNVSLQEWQRRQISSIRAASNSGGFI